MRRYEKMKADARRRPATLQLAFFDSVKNVIHKYPMKVLHKECYMPAMKAIKEATGREEPSLGTCTGVYNRIFGRPCRHQVLQLLVDNKLLLPKHFHPHWWVRRSEVANPPPPIPREPASRRKDLRNRATQKKRGQGINSTRRQLMTSEIGDRRTPQSSIAPTMRNAIAASSQRVIAPRPPPPPPSMPSTMLPPPSQQPQYHQSYYGAPTQIAASQGHWEGSQSQYQYYQPPQQYQSQWQAPPQQSQHQSGYHGLPYSATQVPPPSTPIGWGTQDNYPEGRAFLPGRTHSYAGNRR